MTKKVGSIHIEVLEGRNLIPMDSDGQSDPYCVIIVGEKKKKTKAVRHTLFPKWENEHYDFNIDKNLGSIVIEVYDWDRFSSDDRMGMVVIPSTQFSDYSLEITKWFTLIPIKSEDPVSGEIKLKIRYDKDNSQPQEKNPLIKAIKDNDVAAIEHLMNKSKVDYGICDSEGTPAIHLAIGTNNIPLITLILKASDLKITIKDSHGNSPLHLFSQKCITTTQSDEVILKLIDKGCSVADENALGEIPLHKACLSNFHKTSTIDTLLSKGSNINHQTKTGDTPLHYAIKMNRSDVVLFLLQKGANFNIEGGKPSKKPIDLARELDHTSIVNKLEKVLEISDWLNNLQLESLIPIFIQNEIYMDVITDIDESTLDSLKITVSGQRAKLLRTIKKMKSELNTSFSSLSGSFSSSTSNLKTSYNQSAEDLKYLVNNSPTKVEINSNNSDNSNNNNSSATTIENTGSNSPPIVNDSTPIVNNNNNNHKEENSNNNKQDIDNNNNNKQDENKDNSIAEQPPTTTTTNVINLNVSELSQLKHIHLDSDSWVIDESTLKYSVLLGTGASGKVYKGFYKGIEVAIKVLKSFTDKKDIAEFKKEFQIVSSLKAPGVVNFYGAGIKDKLCIVMEYCSRGSLYHILKDETVQFDWNNFFHLGLQAISSLDSLHCWTPQVLHRDLKSLNLLVTENWTVKICDFGLSRFDTGSNLETLGKLRGTYAYVAPEVYFGNKYTTKSDVYSMGMILWEMTYRCINGVHQFPYQEYPHLKFDYQILISSAKKDVRPTIPPNTPKSLADLISLTLLKDGASRPTTSEFYDALLKIHQEYLANTQEWDSKRIIPESQLPKPLVPATDTPGSSSPALLADVDNSSPRSFTNNNTPPTPSPSSSSNDFTQPIIPTTTSTTDSIKSPVSLLKEQITRTRSSSSPIDPKSLLKQK
ncbi:hypothetical protein CYY_009307 [Polysphondylium violaceum]|uniref:non-specific serine/threonine protein kinase n=1 Tax=Polysphondylium violaceum TaxID=133409 RepID=A0A8J4UW97_9MYCE|nr:hypothetical protein CYY_009307 [Polysphondylium violaceum]